MMRVLFHKKFDKKYRRCSKILQYKVTERLQLFAEWPLDPILENHALTGEYEGLRSINVTGDYRALYRPIEEIAHFVRLGTHSELYGK